MKVPAVLVPLGTLATGGAIPLDDAEHHHLKVRRIAPGDSVTVLDGAGASADAVIAMRGRLAVAEIGAVRAHPRLASTILAVGAGDRERFLGLAERCTEVGVSRLIPLLTERAQAVDNRVRGAALDKARRRAREACKQSGNPWATVIDDPCRMIELPKRVATLRWLVAAADGGPCPALDSAEAVGWIIGPEGGLTPDEEAFALGTLAATAVTLGPHILRFDTAAIVAAGLSLDRRH